MALAMSAALLRRAAGALLGAGRAGRPLWAQVSPLSQAPPPDPPPAAAPPSRYAEKPWEYLDSEEYHVTYGDNPVWAGYRRHHKGSVPPQRTRKACLRKGKRVGNPCPICRDRNLVVDFRNVRLLQQFICPHSGLLQHPTFTGVCMRQHRALRRAIEEARDRGLLWLSVPFAPVPPAPPVPPAAAVGPTPPAPPLLSGGPWYPWYEGAEPPAGGRGLRGRGLPRGAEPAVKTGGQ